MGRRAGRARPGRFRLWRLVVAVGRSALLADRQLAHRALERAVNDRACGPLGERPPGEADPVRRTCPAGWSLDHSFGKEIVFASDRHHVNEITYSDTSIYPGTSLARAERIVSRNDDWKGAPKVGSHVTIDGTTFFHLFGPAGLGRRYDVYACPDDDRLMQLAFRTQMPRPRRERLVASVLASVRLR